ncbi:MAG: PEP_CTERM-anchored TLD domain-containing protein [Pseudomonadota bacterium]
MKFINTALITLALYAIGIAPASAGIIVGGSDILNGTSVGQLETFLGQGQLTLNRIYAKQTGDTASDWHAAVDSQGPTFTVIELDNGRIIGGYNSNSWVSSSGYDYTATGSFLFSLTNNFKHSRYRYNYYIYNTFSYGPTWGGGHDLHIRNDLTTGYTNLGHTYQCRVGSYGSSTCRNDFAGSNNNWAVTRLETFTHSTFVPPLNVSEPGILSILGLALLSLFLLNRRRVV